MTRRRRGRYSVAVNSKQLESGTKALTLTLDHSSRHQPFNRKRNAVKNGQQQQADLNLYTSPDCTRHKYHSLQVQPPDYMHCVDSPEARTFMKSQAHNTTPWCLLIIKFRWHSAQEPASMGGGDVQRENLEVMSEKFLFKTMLFSYRWLSYSERHGRCLEGSYFRSLCEYTTFRVYECDSIICAYMWSCVYGI